MTLSFANRSHLPSDLGHGMSSGPPYTGGVGKTRKSLKSENLDRPGGVSLSGTEKVLESRTKADGRRGLPLWVRLPR
jgi:hypothetical protein